MGTLGHANQAADPPCPPLGWEEVNATALGGCSGTG